MAQKTFRSAFNGFNREDVVHYIDYLNTKLTSEINQLNSELEFLRSKDPKPSPEAQSAQNPSADVSDQVSQQAARIRELFDLCKTQEAQIAELTAQLADARAEVDAVRSEAARLNGDLDQARQSQLAQQSCREEELEAYRRAERTERLARERAEQMYRQANAVLADAAAKVDDAANLIGQMTESVVGELSQLQSAVSGSKQALSDAANSLYAIQPISDNE